MFLIDLYCIVNLFGTRNVFVFLKKNVFKVFFH